MSKIPQAFKDAIETEWRYDNDLNVDTLTMRFRATAISTQNLEDSALYKDLIEKMVASELYELVSAFVDNGEENVKLRELLKRAWHLIMRSTNGATSACEWHEEMFSIHANMRELGIEVD